MQLNLYVIKYNKYSGGGFSVKCLLQLSDAKKPTHYLSYYSLRDLT